MNQVTAQEICNQIMSGSLTNEDLSTIGRALQFVRANMIKSNIASIRVGNAVEFTHKAKNKQITGEVTKIGRKFIYVREHGYSFGNWKVPANMLKLLEA